VSFTGTAEATALAVASRRLTKRFGRNAAVDGIDLAIPRGSVYGFLGPNGSGKTTTIRMLLGLIRPSAGDHDLLGETMPGSAQAVLPRVGSLVEGPAFHPYLTGGANLHRLDAVSRTADPTTATARVSAALERVGLLSAAGKRYRAYSLGMRQRLAIAAALLSPRELLILDEPTNGLDPQGTREVRSLISGFAADGTTVMLSTHLLSEVEQICDHVGVMHRGRLVAEAPLAQLRAGMTPTARLETDAPDAATAVLTDLGLTNVRTEPARDGRSAVVTGVIGASPATTVPPEKVVAALVHAGIGVRGFTVPAPDLEELFVSLTGEGFEL
jgi:lantibiotic transport system ATP-binding protein